MTQDESPTVRALYATMELIHQPKHWLQHSNIRHMDDGIAYCLMGALFRATDDERVRDEAIERLHEAMLIPPGLTSVLRACIAWNDAKGRAHDEVMLVIDEAARRQSQIDHQARKQHPYLDKAHDECFVEIGTDKGHITLVNHNEHNGYYSGFDLVMTEGLT